MLNNSGKWFMLSKSGQVVEGEDNPDAAAVLAAPGAEIPADVVEKYGLKDRLDGPAPRPVDVAGRPIVHMEDGRSISIDGLPPDHPRRVEAEKAAEDAKKPADKPKADKAPPAPKAEAAK
jgi:hypothetical protein